MVFEDSNPRKLTLPKLLPSPQLYLCAGSILMCKTRCRNMNDLHLGIKWRCLCTRNSAGAQRPAAWTNKKQGRRDCQVLFPGSAPKLTPNEWLLGKWAFLVLSPLSTGSDQELKIEHNKSSTWAPAWNSVLFLNRLSAKKTATSNSHFFFLGNQSRKVRAHSPRLPTTQSNEASGASWVSGVLPVTTLVDYGWCLQ